MFRIASLFYFTEQMRESDNAFKSFEHAAYPSVVWIDSEIQWVLSTEKRKKFLAEKRYGTKSGRYRYLYMQRS